MEEGVFDLLIDSSRYVPQRMKLTALEKDEFAMAQRKCQALRESAEKKVVPAVVRMIEKFMEEYAQEPLTISQIARHAGVTARTVQMSFQRFRGLSPMQSLKEIRLRRVSVDLEALQHADVQVSSTALRWGFTHLGRFPSD